MKTKIILYLFISLFLSVSLKSQVAISYIPLQSLLGISSNTDRLLWIDYKLETNTFASNLNMELSPKINFIRKQQVNYYFGSGISINPIYFGSDLPLTNGYFLDFGARIRPFLSCRNVQLLFEVSPYINRSFSGGNFRTRLGVSYNFNRKVKRIESIN